MGETITAFEPVGVVEGGLMPRKELPRLYELIDKIPTGSPLMAYFSRL